MAEFKAFLSIFFNMGLIRKTRISEYWSTKEIQSTPWFMTIMSRNRFQLILKFFHLINVKRIPRRDSPSYNPAAHFEPLVRIMNDRFRHHYVPAQELSVDESLVGTRGRSVMKQYIPTKKHKYGVKLWMLVESTTAYILNIDVYKGKKYDNSPIGIPFASYIVLNLLAAANLLQKAYHVFCDSFFTSLDLAWRLTLMGVHVTRTVRSNRRIPLLIKNGTRAEEKVYVRSSGTLMLRYWEPGKKKVVRLLSTKLMARDGTNAKPEIVNEYNKHMGGVDQSDMMVSFYNGERKTIKVWKKVTFNLFQRIMLNAYILYSKNTTDRPIMSRLSFTQSVIESLALEFKRNEKKKKPAKPRSKLGLAPGGKEHDCVQCSNRATKRRRTRYQCLRCLRAVHPTCNHVCRSMFSDSSDE